jgi:hypothetical protein
MHSRILTLEERLVSEASALDRRTPPATRILIYADTGRPLPGLRSQALVPHNESDELWVLLDSFYYTAHRVLDICNDNRHDLPGLGKVDARGIREVRNHLVEHPTKDEGIVVASIKCGGPSGPGMKPMRFGLDPEGPLDAGLHANCRLFLEAVTHALRQATSACVA